MAENQIDPNDVVIIPPEDRLEGVRQKAAKFLENGLKNGRRYFGSSASMTTHEIHNPEYKKEEINTDAIKGLQETVRKSTDFLREWMKDKPNVVLVDSVKTPHWGEFEIDEETGMIIAGYTDHIMFIGDEVILIDTKDWGKKKSFILQENGEIYKSNKHFPGGDTKTALMIDKWLDYLEAGASLTGLVHIHGDENKVLRNRNWFMQTFRVVEHDRFEELLNEKWELINETDKREINSSLISQAVVKCIKPYDEYQKILTKDAVSGFKKGGRR